MTGARAGLTRSVQYRWAESAAIRLYTISRDESGVWTVLERTAPEPGWRETPLLRAGARSVP